MNRKADNQKVFEEMQEKFGMSEDELSTLLTMTRIDVIEKILTDELGIGRGKIRKLFIEQLMANAEMVRKARE